MNEIEIMRKINHKNIINLHEFFETEKSVYLVLDFLEGGEIFKISDGKLKAEDAKIIMKSLLKSVQYLRSIGVIHRDLKPDNIILEKQRDVPISENTVKLIDFGLAADIISNKPLIHRKCGTPGFIAPEVVHMKKTDVVSDCLSCDTFSLGMIFFFMMTGVIPYDGKDIKEILENNKIGHIDWKIGQLKRVDPQALNLIQAMLEMDPNERITPTEALSHPYFGEGSLFSDEESNYEVEDENNDLNLGLKLKELHNAYRNEVGSSFYSANSIKFNLKEHNNNQNSSDNSSGSKDGQPPSPFSKASNSPGAGRKLFKNSQGNNGFYKHVLMQQKRMGMKDEYIMSMDGSPSNQSSFGNYGDMSPIKANSQRPRKGSLNYSKTPKNRPSPKNNGRRRKSQDKSRFGRGGQ